jgi:hypothetical protein
MRWLWYHAQPVANQWDRRCKQWLSRWGENDAGWEPSGVKWGAMAGHLRPQRRQLLCRQNQSGKSGNHCPSCLMQWGKHHWHLVRSEQQKRTELDHLMMFGRQWSGARCQVALWA